MKTYVVTPHSNRLGETVLMMGHNMCFTGEIWKIIPKLSLLPLLNWSKQCRLSADCSKMKSLIRSTLFAILSASFGSNTAE